jgi:exodeoxyribonuclease III
MAWIMKLATFNVNSLKIRLPVVLEWLGTHQPDILMLQEIKGLDIPELDLNGAGYYIQAHLQKTYHGVMTLTRTPHQTLATTLDDFSDDEQARVLLTRAADGTGPMCLNIYAPNGNPVGSDKYAYKMRWLRALLVQIQRWRTAGDDFVVAGDFNIIPDTADAATPSAWIHDALFQDEVRALYRAILYTGMTDALAATHIPAGDHYTFWDYQAGAWPRNNGIRIDHILLSPRLADRMTTAFVDRAPRVGDRPSDHTPVVVECSDL